MITLPAVLDRATVLGLGGWIEQAADDGSLRLDGSQIRRVDTPGVQLLCAMVLAAEGRGVNVSWTAVPATLVAYVNLLGIADVMRLAGMRQKGRVVRLPRAPRV